jgi:hypothetical protein
MLVVLFWLPSAVWGLSGPLFSVPDEQQQVIKAVSIWYGQVSGEPVTGQAKVVRSYRVPAVWSNPQPCYAFRPNVTPNLCSTPMRGNPNRMARLSTYDGGFPPLYYALVGWAGRLFPSSKGVRLMRLVSGLLSALFLAAAVRALARVIRSPLAVLGVAASATPMTFFLGGSINPSGFEITAAIALWAHMLAVVGWRNRSDAPVPRSLLVGLVVSGTALAFTRFLDPVMVGAIVVTCLFTASAAGWRALRRDRAVLVAVGVLAGLSMMALISMILPGDLQSLGGSTVPAGLNGWLLELGRSGDVIRQMVAWFGWLDTPPPDFVLWAWLGVTGAVAAIALVLGGLRRSSALLVAAAVAFLTPIVVQGPRVHSNGIVWQGRHGLPLAVGVVMVAVVLIDRHVPVVAGLRRRLPAGALAVLGVAQVYALWWNLHRYAVGLSSTAIALTGGAWQPAGGTLVWLLAMSGFAAGLVGLAAWAPADDPLADQQRPDPGPVPVPGNDRVGVIVDPSSSVSVPIPTPGADPGGRRADT